MGPPKLNVKATDNLANLLGQWLFRGPCGDKTFLGGLILMKLHGDRTDIQG